MWAAGNMEPHLAVKQTVCPRWTLRCLTFGAVFNVRQGDMLM